MPSQDSKIERQLRWQPIKNIPLIARSIDEMLEHAEDHYLALQAVKYKRHRLEESTRYRLVGVYTKQQKTLGSYQQQLDQWKTEKLTSIHKSEVLRLEGQLEKLRIVIALILTQVR